MPDITINNDGIFDISIGRSRAETSWKNKEWLWSELVKKVSETHYTAETHAEYMAAKKARQDEIKDIGGFLGGYINGGRKKNGNILHRQLVTLDVDFGNADFWDDFILLYGNAAALYSTHKHTPETPRLRLILPLDRPVSVDEYTAISRRIAGNLGIETFDPTTFEPTRLMYWPSTSKNGEYLFEYQDGEWLIADDVLASYHNWQDASEWPVSERYNATLRRAMTKQGDPLEKSGVVGAFCRTYSIQEAIEDFLADAYEPCDTPGRYTYKEGSTAAGLVIYEDKYAFSHHGTDPVSGKLCNAFDIIRLHKFGLKDEDVREGTPGNKLPSYMAMLDFASQDAKVRKNIVADRLSNAKGDFDTPEDAEELPEDSDEWKERLDVDRKGNIYATIDNIVLIFENDPYIKGRLGFDDFEKCEVATKDLPWRKVSWTSRRLTDRDDANIRHYLEKVYGISNTTKTRDALQILSEKTCFHPIKDYLNSLKWDGVSRVESLLVDYQGAEDSEYVRTVIRKMLVAAVARVFNPGVKFDTILTLIGTQGLKKSSLIAKLGKQWFSDSFSFNQLRTNETKACEQIQGVWIIEIPEMSGMAKTEVETVKHFVSKTDDRFRVAYGRRTENFPRQCVFFATTNKSDFLRDPSGNRRYWPVPIAQTSPKKDVLVDLTDVEVDQIWAEALVFYRNGEKLYLTNEMLAVAETMQKEHTEEHPWADMIRNYLDVTLPSNWNELNIYDKRAYLAGDETLIPKGFVVRNRVCVQEIWAEAIRGRDTIDVRSAGIIRDIMANIDGWEFVSKVAKYGAYGPQRKGYLRTETSVTESVTKTVTGETIVTENKQKGYKNYEDVTFL